MALSSAACSMWQSPVPPPSAAHLQFDRAVGLAMVQGVDDHGKSGFNRRGVLHKACLLPGDAAW